MGQVIIAMPWLILALLTLLGALQYRLWLGEGGLADLDDIKHEVKIQRAELAVLRERNAALEAEVKDLKNGLSAMEEKARSELGMIKQGEIFYQVIEEPPPKGRTP
ncbi:cell division protein FtsB [Gammaproteobacteria bacterium]